MGLSESSEFSGLAALFGVLTPIAANQGLDTL
jgi:hypothetical protein